MYFTHTRTHYVFTLCAKNTVRMSSVVTFQMGRKIALLNVPLCAILCLPQRNFIFVSAAFFYAGNSKAPSASGFRISDEKGS
jgi:hypothetical protein